MVSLSFEFFPAKTPRGEARLDAAADSLAPLSPEFMSVTYGAGGGTRHLTGAAAERLAARTGLPIAPHLTCVGATREETMEVARGYWAAGLREIVALRGDPPGGVEAFTPHPGGFSDSSELVAALAGEGWRVRVGAYPERHPEAPDEAADARWLARKLDAGAEAAITQFFFEAETFFRFRDACAAAGITAPILPGILPVRDWEKASALARRCGAAVPAAMDEAYAAATAEGREAALAEELAIRLCEELVEGGERHLHFYTLNDADLTLRICAALGLGAEVGAPRAAAG